MTSKLTCLLLLMLLQACAAHVKKPVSVEAHASAVSLQGIDASAELFGDRPVIPSTDQLLALSEQQQAEFIAFLNSPLTQSVPMYQRVADYLVNITSAFNYQGETLTAASALQARSGNCLSLALLTTALADMANVKIGYQLLDDLPVYEYYGSIIEKGVHVRSLLYGPQSTADAENASRHTILKVDYFPSGNRRLVANLARNSFIAMYYTNHAAEALISADLDTAYWYVRESLEFAPANAEAINMLAVLHKRKGNVAVAEQLYRYGIAHADNKLSILKNYKVLLENANRHEEAAAIGLQLAALDDPSPFNWLQQARYAYEAGDFSAAIGYYNRALKLAPYLHQAYVGIAISLHELGDDEAARRSLQQALAIVYKPSTKVRYEAKLAALSH